MSQTPSQQLVFGAGDCVAWLDASVSTSLTHPVTPDHVTAIADQAMGLTYTYALQTNTMSSTSSSPTLDSARLLAPALVLKTGYLWAPSVQTLADNQGRFALFYVGGYDGHSTDERMSWLFANEPSLASTHYPPSTTNAGGVLFKRVAGTNASFTLTFSDTGGHSVTSDPFTLTNNAFVMSILVGINGYAHPTITVRVNGAATWSYDAGQLNPDGLNFINQAFTSVGTGPGADGGLEVTGEVIAYQGLLAGGTHAQIESYLTTKWVPAQSTITVGSLSNQNGAIAQGYSATIAITNATTVAVSTIAANVGTNWAAHAPTDSSNVWTITGVFPVAQTNFQLVLTITDSSGTQIVQRLFPMTVSLTGTPSTFQQLVQASGAAVWLDPSDATTVTQANGRVTYVRDKAAASGFTPTSSETPALNTGDFNINGLSFAKSSESSSGFNYALTLDPTTRPELFGNSTAPFLSGSVTANEPMGNGIAVTGSDGSYTIVLVLSQDGQVGGAPPADLTISNDFPANALEYCVSKWGVKTPTLGSTQATVWASDAVTDAVVTHTGAAATPNRFEGVVPLGINQPAVIVWRYDSTNGLLLRINGANVALNFTHGSVSTWSSVAQRLTQIAGSHSLGTLGEFLAFPSSLAIGSITQIESYLGNKWFAVVGATPTISNPSVSTAYATYPYAATVTITNGGSNPITAQVQANAGLNWAITQDQTTPTLFHITGTMPATAQLVTLTIMAEQDNATATKVVSLTSQALPTAPVIGTLSTLIAAKGAAYTGTITVTNAHNNDSSLAVHVSATQGTGWAVAASGTANVYNVTGTLPNVVTEFNLTITANDQSGDGLANNSVNRVFRLETTGNPSLLTPQYQLDLTGLLPGNKINDDTQTLASINGLSGQFLVPRLAPFFAHGLVLQYHAQGGGLATAVPGVDYQPVCELQALSQATAFPVYTAISVMNEAIDGTVHLAYQTLGGNFVIDRAALLGGLADKIVNQRELDWSNVINLPLTYPVAPHTHQVDADLIGLAGLVSAITGVQTAYAAKAQSKDLNDMAAHIANHTNPHGVNSGQIGLGAVPNFPPASDAEAQTGTASNRLLTPHTAALVARQGLQQASATVAGLAPLNEGNAAGDDSNSTDALTAAGLLALITASSSNQIKTNFVSGEQIAQITPYPITFPVWWRGIQYTTLTALLYAIETYVSVEVLPFNQATGTLFFPKNVTVPNLVLSATNTGTGTRNFTTDDNASMPLLVPTGPF